jgi:hypothetical protein
MKKKINLQVPNIWFATSNHCLKRHKLTAFVDWYYPSCITIKKLDPIKISWYHERIFSLYILHYNFNITNIGGLHHQFSNSHQPIHNNLDDLSHDLIELYINNPSCEFLMKMVDNYHAFKDLLLKNFTHGIGSYLTDGLNNVYDPKKYNKQKLLFESAKNAKNVLLIGDYRNHISFIMLLANPNLKITCIEKTDYENKHNVNIIQENEDEKRVNILYSLNNVDFDLIHISQIYPERKYLFDYMDFIGDKCINQNIKLIIDDIDVYPTNFRDIFINNNINCKIIKEEKSDCIFPNLLLEIKINKMYFLTYNDDSGNYDKDIQKLVDSVKKYSYCEIIVFHKKDINPYFIQNNQNIFNHSKGGGYWLWKPYIIKETLDKLKEGDILLYIDSKYYFTEPFKNLFTNKMHQDIIIWKNKPNEPHYVLKQWCKMEVIQKYNMYHATFMDNYEICWGGAMILRKSNNIKSLISRWLDICCNENNITDKESSFPNSSDFIDHRHDQSLLSIVLHEFNIQLHFFEKKYLQNTRIPY